MKLISRATCPDGIEDCDYALIDLTPDLARLALKRITWLNEYAASDPDLFKLYCWGSGVDFFSPWLAQDSGEADRLPSIIEQLPTVTSDLFKAPSDFTLADNLCARLDCCEMVVRTDTINFVAIPKHTDVYVETAEVPRSLFEEADAERPSADSHVERNA